jgi:hypothetical protein
MGYEPGSFTTVRCMLRARDETAAKSMTCDDAASSDLPVARPNAHHFA